MFLEARGHAALAGVLFRQRELEAAEREALASIEQLVTLRLEAIAATAMLARVRLAQGRVDEALAGAEEAMGACESIGSFGFGGARVPLVLAEALWAAGRRDRARAAIASARDRLRLRAALIGDPVLTRSFLESISENARTFELAYQWLGEPE
jgi:hypothetical protein